MFGNPEWDPLHACTQPLTMQDSMNAYSGWRPGRNLLHPKSHNTPCICFLHLSSGRRLCRTRSPIIRPSVWHAPRQAHRSHRTITHSSAILSIDRSTPIQPREGYIWRASRPLRHFSLVTPSRVNYPYRRLTYV